MREYVEQLAGGVGNEEASHTPRLVDQIMDDLASDLFRTTIDLVHIIHLDRQIGHGRTRTPFAHAARSEERRVGKEWVSRCRSRWSPYNEKKKKKKKNN